MLRLLKYGLFALLAYCVYEMILGMTETAALPGTEPQPTPPPGPDASASPSPTTQQLSGPTHQGSAVRVHDPSGVGRTQRVGRGVVRR